MDTMLMPILDELRCYFQTMYGPRLAQLVLYGSQARGDAEPGSDIDILVVLHGSVNPGEEIARVGDFTTDLSLKYNVVVSCVFIAAKRLQNEETPFLLNVRKEGVAL
jgi:predicted nucleotidyltransferase